MKTRILFVLFACSFVFLNPGPGGWVNPALAGNTDPGADGHRYSWAENVGWMSFAPAEGPGVTVTDAGLSGYVWSENTGWINLTCQNNGTCATVDYGVLNNGAGVLSGYAWAENAGWISFSCENAGTCATVDYGVQIDTATGLFSGKAWAENLGWVSFDYAIAVTWGVLTSWTGGFPGGGCGPGVILLLLQDE